MKQECLFQEEVPKQAVDALIKALGERLVAVVLFGSRARGDASPDSDWDLLIIAEGLPENPFDRHLHLRRLLPPDCAAVAILAKSPKEFESHLPSLYLDIGLDGKTLHDPQGYAAKRLSDLRRIIHKAGLFREHTEAGDVWRWQEGPAQPWSLAWEE